MAGRKELLDLVAEKKLISGSAAGYFGLRFANQLERDLATGSEGAMGAGGVNRSD